MARRKETRKKTVKRRTVKKRIRRKSSRSKRTKKTDIKKIIFLSIVSILVLSLILYIYNQLNQTVLQIEEDNRPDEIVVEDMIGKSCKRNVECFSVGCKSSPERECVNADKMVVYHENCEAYWDVDVERQDFEKCACVDGYCKNV